MGEPAYKAQLVRALPRWLRLVPSAQPFRLPLVGPEGGSVLFMQTGDITDLLFAAPLLSSLHRTYPRCRIGLLVRENSSELIRHHPHVHDLLFYQAGQMHVGYPAFFRLARRLRKRAYDLVVHMGDGPSPAQEVLGYMSGARVRIGPASDKSYPYINCEVRRDPDKSAYGTGRLSEVAGLLGVRLDPDARAALLTEQDLRFARQLVHFRKPRQDQILIGVDPGKGKSHTKVLDRTLAFLLNAIYQRYRAKVAVLAVPEQEEFAQRFEQALRCERLELPRHNIKDVVAVLSQCDVFLAGNTDLLHFAVAFGVPTVGLFTDRDDPRWTPPALPHVAVIHGRRGTKLSLDDFLHQVERLLSLPPRR